MFRTSIRRLLLVLALGLTLGSSAALASPLNWGNVLTEEGRTVSRLFAGVLMRASGSQRLKAGCSISPDGQPSCAPKTTAEATRMGSQSGRRPPHPRSAAAASIPTVF
jgi:hypothetical protein